MAGVVGAAHARSHAPEWMHVIASTGTITSTVRLRSWNARPGTHLCRYRRRRRRGRSRHRRWSLLAFLKFVGPARRPTRPAAPLPSVGSRFATIGHSVGHRGDHIDSLEEVLVDLHNLNCLLDLDANSEPNHQPGQTPTVDQNDPCRQVGGVVASALAEAS